VKKVYTEKNETSLSQIRKKKKTSVKTSGLTTKERKNIRGKKAERPGGCTGGSPFIGTRN